MTTPLTEQELAYLAQVYALEARTYDPTSPAAKRAAMIVRLVDEVRDVRVAYLATAEECERRAAEIDEGQGRVMPVEAAQPLESLAAWARQKAGE